jgi:hypothetical protein
MLQSVPSRASAAPRLLATFGCPTFVIVQITGPNTLYLAETQQQLMMFNDDGTIDALQLTQAGANGGIYTFWWNGPMYAAGSQAVGTVFKPFIGIPGADTGGLVTSDQSAYGVGPSGSDSNPTPAGGYV